MKHWKWGVPLLPFSNCAARVSTENSFLTVATNSWSDSLGLFFVKIKFLICICIVCADLCLSNNRSSTKYPTFAKIRREFFWPKFFTKVFHQVFLQSFHLESSHSSRQSFIVSMGPKSLRALRATKVSSANQNGKIERHVQIWKENYLKIIINSIQNYNN